jgi:hypothetical protein
MANTRAVFSALAAVFPAANFPQLTLVNRRPVLGFDASTAETCYFETVAPQGLTGAQNMIVHYFMASATSGKVDFEVAVEAVTPGDAVDLDAADSFDTANGITAPTVPGTAGYESSFTCTLTNVDSMAAGDHVRFSLKRDAADGTNDTATGDCYVYKVEWRDAV